MTKGSWARFGIQQTPLLDYEEGIYRYRFQGTTFTEREGFYNSSDAGASFHYNFPSNYGDVHVGVYNGESYAKTDPNDQKAHRDPRHGAAVRDADARPARPARDGLLLRRQLHQERRARRAASSRSPSSTRTSTPASTTSTRTTRPAIAARDVHAQG